MGVIAKYKFNNTLEANLLPEFNSKFTSDLYTVTDEVDGGVTTRTIESDNLPTLMRFGRTYVEGETSSDNRTDSLLEVLDMNTSGLTSCSNMFRYNKNLTGITCEWNTSNVTTMYAMFYNCYNLTTLDVSNWDTSNVTTMNNMFHYCDNLTTLDVSNFNTSNATSMYQMFRNCQRLTSLDVSNFDTSKVTNMASMFYNCKSLTSLDVSNFNTSNATNMSNMFNNCNNLTSLDVSNWNTNNVTNMGYMFQNCINLTSLDVSGFNTSNVTNMYAMFNNCYKLTTLDLSNFNTNNVTNMDYMLNLCNNLKYLKCNNINTLNILNAYLPTKSSTSQGTIICKSDITNLDTTTLSSKYWNILDEPTLIAKYVFDKSIHNNCIPEFNTGFEGYFIEDEVVEGNEVTRTIESCGMLPTTMRFGHPWTNNEEEKIHIDRCKSLLEILDMNTSNIRNMAGMFRICNNLTKINCDWVFHTDLTNMGAVFQNCFKLISLDTSNWNTSNITNMGNMFNRCNNLTLLDVSNFNTSKVTNMMSMFSNCTKLTTLDVSNWKTNNVTNMSSMFSNCNNLASLDLSNFNTNNVTNTTNMFANTPLLTDISVLYMDKSSLQKLVDAMPTDSNKTLWYKDVNIDGITHGDNITLKKYMEGNVEIVLNSPLLEGDTIEVKDGKLCHVHRYEKVVLDGNEDEGWSKDGTLPVFKYRFGKTINGEYLLAFCDNFLYIAGIIGAKDFNCFKSQAGYLQFRHISCDTLDTFKQWLQANPTTVVYELETPYYEDITNLQSVPTLKTYLECSMEIDTDLPIDTNITYRTNLSSVYVMERELDELDNGTDLGDILEGEVNE